ncbi:hypothetical protein GDO86_000525 [Hymenochirus boettgeri]|uniref:Uncharacterized protein n=1 Tax=Hymenochirus boettgeri TaxID=247094 RepID=A0A8T2K9U6_9PIPI|nr:hypothetical protein GDO86_000525 [Hymenochirus boettgeri]
MPEISMIRKRMKSTVCCFTLCNFPNCYYLPWHIPGLLHFKNYIDTYSGPNWKYAGQWRRKTHLFMLICQRYLRVSSSEHSLSNQ